MVFVCFVCFGNGRCKEGKAGMGRVRFGDKQELLSASVLSLRFFGVRRAILPFSALCFLLFFVYLYSPSPAPPSAPFPLFCWL